MNPNRERVSHLLRRLQVRLSCLQPSAAGVPQLLPVEAGRGARGQFRINPAPSEHPSVPAEELYVSRVSDTAVS
jgi:hypothetical protein